MFVKYNNNPVGANAGDCVIRAISLATGDSWEKIYTALCVEGLAYGDMPNANAGWDNYLRSIGFKRNVCPNDCPACYSIADFAAEHSSGVYIAATGRHVVAVIDGSYYDTWDSGSEVPIYFFTKEKG